MSRLPVAHRFGKSTVKEHTEILQCEIRSLLIFCQQYAVHKGEYKIFSLDRNLKSESLNIMLQCLALNSFLSYPAGTVFESRSGHR